MMSIIDLQSQLRDIINAPRKRRALSENQASWSMLLSCLDVIADVELCFDAFLSEQVSDGHVGMKYLHVYGALQAIFVQQDAVYNLTQALNIPYRPDPALKEIREIRNDSVGHPTKRDSKQRRSYNHISRMSLKLPKFKLMTVYEDNSPYRFTDVNVLDLITKQREILSSVLSNIIAALRREEMDHRAKFADTLLVDIFHSNLSYYIEKIFEGIQRPEYAELGLGCLQLVQDVIEQFKRGLSEREIDGAYVGIEITLNELEYPIQELERCLKGSPETICSVENASILAFFVREKMRDLEAMAAEVDADYSGTEI